MPVLKSKVDASVNFIEQAVDGGKIEARFVQRRPSYFIIYVSSHTGCTQACRMCHLTQTGQTTFSPVRVNEFLHQVATVLDYYDTTVTYNDLRAERVHVNFMARGEPLLNANVNDDLFKILSYQCVARQLVPVFKVSTIFPVSCDIGFKSSMSQIYYSLYSVNPDFRKRWLPKAEDPIIALHKLNTWRNKTGNEVRLHWALIEGENDSEEDAEEVVKLLKSQNFLDIGFNLVRYNPPNRKSKESNGEQIERYLNILRNSLLYEVKEVPRVGFDVKASCGMFIAA